jgi:hypothetical protein
MAKTKKADKSSTDDTTTYKKMYEDTLKKLTESEQLSEGLGSAVEALTEALGEAMGDASKIQQLVDKNLSAIEYHCTKTKQYTGELLAEDVSYAVSMARRVLDYTLNQETED